MPRVKRKRGMPCKVEEFEGTFQGFFFGFMPQQETTDGKAPKVYANLVVNYQGERLFINSTNRRLEKGSAHNSEVAKAARKRIAELITKRYNIDDLVLVRAIHYDVVGSEEKVVESIEVRSPRKKREESQSSPQRSAPPDDA